MGLLKSLRTREDKEQDFELNLASVIDCLTVLVTYLLVSTSFISMGALEVGLAEPTASQEAVNGGGAVTATILLGQNKDVKIQVSGSGISSRTFSLADKDGNWDVDSLVDKLNELKDKYPKLNTATIAADSTVEYSDIVKIIENTRKSLPFVYLGDRSME